jgi:hypothetical protein
MVSNNYCFTAYLGIDPGRQIGSAMHIESTAGAISEVLSDQHVFPGLKHLRFELFFEVFTMGCAHNVK